MLHRSVSVIGSLTIKLFTFYLHEPVCVECASEEENGVCITVAYWLKLDDARYERVSERQVEWTDKNEIKTVGGGPTTS